MIFAKIDYINLLPFYIFLKKELKNPAYRAALEHKKGVPSKINEDFRKFRVEAAFISSIFSPRFECTRLGIVAKKEIRSVIVCPGENRNDKDSNTSNVLAKILNVKGEVLIGDKALKRFHSSSKCLDLAGIWYDKYSLPFVFARFCFRKDRKLYTKLAEKFLNTKIKIPRYILKRYAKKSGLSEKEIREYLKLIDYKIDKKGEISLKKFIFLSKKFR